MRALLKRIAGQPKLLIALMAAFVSFTIMLDQALKEWATGLLFPFDFWIFRFFPIGNSGIFGGYFSDLDPWIIRIFFCVLFGFLFLGVALMIYLLRYKPAPRLKIGLVIYVAGVFGNVWDRMTTGTVVDYAVIRLPGLSGMAFNFADGVVLTGALVIAVAVFKEADALWYGDNQRQGYWIEPGFQREFGFTLVLLVFAHFLVIGIYSYVFLKAFISGSGGSPALSADRIIRDYLFGLTVIEGAALLLTFVGSVFFSHRLIGPLFAFRQFIERKKKNGPAPVHPLRLRRSDYFKKILETIADSL